MKPLLLLLLVVGALLPAQEPTVATSTAPLQVTPASKDFGTIKDDKILAETFVIHNSSDQPVRLTTLASICDCTIAKPDPSVVPPKGQSTVQVLFQPKGKRGLFEWEVALQTDLPGEPKIVIPLKAFVLRDARLSEEIVNFGVFRKGSPKLVTIWLTDKDHPKFELQEATVTTPGFHVQSLETTVTGFYPGDQRGYKITVSPQENIEYGRHAASLLLITDIPGHPKIELQLFAYVIGEITAAPEYLPFGTIRPGMVLKRTIIVSHNDYKEFEVQKVVSTIPFLTTELKTILPKKYYQIEVTLAYPEKTEGGEFRGQLEIHTDCANHLLVPVHIQGFLQIPKAVVPEKSKLPEPKPLETVPEKP